MINFDIKKYKMKELSGGLRCKTFLLENDLEKKIYQEYYENTRYQAEKKFNVTNLIKQNNNNILIPKAYFWGEDDQKNWLVTEYKEGKMLSELRKQNFSLNSIAKSLAENLSLIHNIKGKEFGWITDKSLISYSNFSDYLISELHRFEAAVKNDMDKKDLEVMINSAKEVIEKVKSLDNLLVPELIWFDLNPNNILVKEKDGKYELSSIIDVGGAKYGVKEWDLAFLKMEVCLNEDEYNIFLGEYQKNNKNINTDLIDLLSVFIELDDMIIRVLDHENVPIPYASNFKSIIKKYNN